MTEKPWSDTEIAGLEGNIQRKRAIGAAELWETFCDMNPDIDPETMSDEKVKEWELFRDDILKTYVERRIAKIAELPRVVYVDGTTH